MQNIKVSSFFHSAPIPKKRLRQRDDSTKFIIKFEKFHLNILCYYGVINPSFTKGSGVEPITFEKKSLKHRTCIMQFQFYTHRGGWYD